MIQNSSLLSDSRWDIYVQKRTMPAPGYRVKLLNLLEQRGIVRARDLTAAGIPLVYLHRLTAAGEVLRLGRGLYQRPDRAGEHAAHDLAEAAVRVPSGVISLISALRFHDLTTELPRAVWMTIPQRTRTPRADGVRLEIVRASGRVMTSGIENVEIEGFASRSTASRRLSPTASNTAAVSARRWRSRHCATRCAGARPRQPRSLPSPRSIA
ncbi:MAG: type IV toxin-antitoxin system AbiEi family antitoxin domain-containing protein [Myxococcales bacterium]|nr:type IV toxin-antitoxin system AbiEi family antitoxin domain-containing protein [Myxococcales bacterium]